MSYNDDWMKAEQEEHRALVSDLAALRAENERLKEDNVRACNYAAARIEALEGALYDLAREALVFRIGTAKQSPNLEEHLQKALDNAKVMLKGGDALLPSPPSESCCHSPEPDKCAACNAEFEERRDSLHAPRKEQAETWHSDLLAHDLCSKCENNDPSKCSEIRKRQENDWKTIPVGSTVDACATFKGKP
jgi:hypothetical protein